MVGASGTIGGALVGCLRSEGSCFAEVLGFSRSARRSTALSPNSTNWMDLCIETSIEEAASKIASRGLPLRLIINAAGFLHGDDYMPEKSSRHIDPEHMQQSFAINAIGSALLAKHFLPLLPVDGKSAFVTLSARVGSISDNRLGGWYSYRASKAALNQIVRTAALELTRRQRNAICVALHPGTISGRLTAPFQKQGLSVSSPQEGAARLLDLIDRLTAEHNGCFLDYRGDHVPW